MLLRAASQLALLFCISASKVVFGIFFFFSTTPDAYKCISKPYAEAP